MKTSIEWTEHSINPIRARRPSTGAVGHYCEKISPGCAHCYASRLQTRFGLSEFMGAGKVTVRDHVDLEVFLDRSKLEEVLGRKKPTTYFWCDMTDMFGSWVPDEWIDYCFAVMAMTPQHTHQVLTKRSVRMASYIASAEGREFKVELSPKFKMRPFDWPLPNVWLGVSVEDQKRADERIPHLLQTPAALRFLSLEPLLDQVILHKYLAQCECGRGHGFTSCPNYGGVATECDETGCKQLRPKIGWAIIGGESGPGARMCLEECVRHLVGQLQAVGVLTFVKQLGARPYRREVLTSRLGPELRQLKLIDRKGGDPNEWSPDLRIRQMPAIAGAERKAM